MANTQHQETTVNSTGIPLAGFEAALTWMSFGVSTAQVALEAFQGTIRFVSACQDVNLKFVHRRIDKNAELGKLFGNGSSFEGTLRTCSEYNRDMIEDCIKRGQDIGKFSIQAVNEFSGSIEKRAQSAANSFQRAA